MSQNYTTEKTHEFIKQLLVRSNLVFMAFIWRAHRISRIEELKLWVFNASVPQPNDWLPKWIPTFGFVFRINNRSSYYNHTWTSYLYINRTYFYSNTGLLSTFFHGNSNKQTEEIFCEFCCMLCTISDSCQFSCVSDIQAKSHSFVCHQTQTKPQIQRQAFEASKSRRAQIHWHRWARTQSNVNPPFPIHGWRTWRCLVYIFIRIVERVCVCEWAWLCSHTHTGSM